jgi:hypothetical protein
MESQKNGGALRRGDGGRTCELASYASMSTWFGAQVGGSRGNFSEGDWRFTSAEIVDTA